MASAGATKVKEAFGLVIIGVILAPIAYSMANAANVTGTALVIITVLPTLLLVVVAIHMVGLL